MVTLGAQQALFLLAELLVGPGTTVAIEDPGYPDARNIVSLRTSHIRPVPIDRHGAVPAEELAGCDYLFVTPSCQCPTAVTMPLERREALLELAAARDFVIVEDDYETRSSLVEAPTPALKSLDRAGRVLYVGSLSKVLAPGLRLGFLVGPPELVREARAMRRLMVRHPPANNQRTAAHFLSLGHHEALGRRLAHIHRARAQAMRRALDRHLPEFACSIADGGSGAWIEGPPWLDARALAGRASGRGVLIEPGDVFFAGPCPPMNYLRLGFSSIPADRIEPGIAELARLVREMAPARARRRATGARPRAG
jgi:GntR family transcriptional regulator/MocR family aminotransferase